MDILRLSLAVLDEQQRIVEVVTWLAQLWQSNGL